MKFTIFLPLSLSLPLFSSCYILFHCEEWRNVISVARGGKSKSRIVKSWNRESVDRELNSEYEKNSMSYQSLNVHTAFPFPILFIVKSILWSTFTPFPKRCVNALKPLTNPNTNLVLKLKLFNTFTTTHFHINTQNLSNFIKFLSNLR